ncbi:MAG: 50S ribosomal protein L3 [Candidatus Bostrichicola ureolyticus]|nr:MAG: 50S ribosomal protein L3 [Candidatus Bostrichicola ureolyticus]
MLGIIGKYIGMISLYDIHGISIPCSIIKAGPCTITQIKTIDKDSYCSIQLGFEHKNEKNTNKPLKGHFKKANTLPHKKLVEFTGYFPNLKLGDNIKVNIFHENELINITGFSKGKGFQGVVKRHGFAGVGESTHGQHNRLRAPGSIGAGSDPSRVFKGTLMAGRTGNERITIKNIKLIKIDIEKDLLIVKGSVPGYKNSYLIINKIINGSKSI